MGRLCSSGRDRGEPGDDIVNTRAGRADLVGSFVTCSDLRGYRPIHRDATVPISIPIPISISIVTNDDRSALANSDLKKSEIRQFLMEIERLGAPPSKSILFNEDPV